MNRLVLPSIQLVSLVMRIFRTLFLFIGAALSGNAIAHDPPRYALRLADDGGTVSVRLCLKQSHTSVKFAADSPDAMKYIRNLHRDGNDEANKNAHSWTADDWRAGECLSYEVDLDAIAAAHDQDIGWRLGDDRVSAPQLLLLRPDAQQEADAEAIVTLPQGWSFSAPWREKSRNAKSIHFDIPNTPANWSANVAFGHFKEERILLPGGMLRVSILQGADEMQRKKIHNWLSRVTRAILSAYGKLPIPDVQVLVFPLASHGRAVMFGQSIRGEGNALELLVDVSRPQSEFESDWVAVHELSHLMHPYLGDSGSWLAEGLATYYQNVLRARAGLLTPAQAWDRLREGFSGQRMTYETPLVDASRNMHTTHDFQRVYWSGAAFWLIVDRDLRRDSDGKLTLDIVLSRFHDCCLPAYQGWHPDDFVAKLDELAGSETISTRYREFAAMRTFPDWKKVYDDLGIHEAGTHLQLDTRATHAALRDAIMAPRNALH